MSKMTARVGMDKEKKRWMEEMKANFHRLAGDEDTIEADQFQAILGLKDEYFAKNLFKQYDSDSSGYLSVDEFMAAIKALTIGTWEDQLHVAFRMYDVDGDNAISVDELAELLARSVQESKLDLAPRDFNKLVNSLYHEFHPAGDTNGITFEEFQRGLDKYPELVNNLQVGLNATWLKGPQRQRARKANKSQAEKFKRYWDNNHSTVILLALYIILNLGLFVFWAVFHLAFGPAIMIAKGCGMCLNFNSAIILFPMLRKSLTYIRQTKLADVLPLDKNVEAHKLMGNVIFGFGLVHTAAHFANYILNPQIPFWAWLFTTRGGQGWVLGTAGITGVVLLIIMIGIFVGAREKIRRSGHFEVFYYTHLLYTLYYPALIIHGPIFWMFFLIPGVWFITDQIWRLTTSTSRTNIVKAKVLASGVTYLEIKRPENFDFRAGEYLNIKCPAISKREWHPFTISSAPEKIDILTVHIRTAGNWTNAIRQYYRSRQQHQRLEQFQSEDSKIEYLEKQQELETDDTTPCYLDGPFGAPAEHVFQVEHAILIGAGIGITPFGSILDSIMVRWVRKKESLAPLKKVDFFLVNREQRQFEWFVDVLRQVENIQDDDPKFKEFMNIHIYMTGAQAKTNMRAVGLQLALDIVRGQDQRDVVTGLRARTQAGRPNWNAVFSELANSPHSSKSAFFCGPPGLAKVLRRACHKNNIVFHKENF